jgi:hypothetical protein
MMRRLLILAVLVALILPGAAPALTGISRFRTTESAHVGTGALEIWRVRILLVRESQTIGSGIIACIRFRNVRQCIGTYVLPSGRVTVQGQYIANRERLTLTITGGTGSYAGVKGVAISSQIACCPRQAFLTFYFV